MNFDTWQGFEHQIEIYEQRNYLDYVKKTVNDYLLEICGYCLSVHDKEEQRAIKHKGKNVISRYKQYIDFNNKDMIWCVCRLSTKYKIKYGIKDYFNKYLAKS